MEDFSSVLVAILTSVLGFAGGIASSYFMFRGQKVNAVAQNKTAAAQQVEVIFGGYSQIVQDLQEELDRLKTTIEELRSEQEACEARNIALENEITDLRSRISNLEKREEEHHGE